MWCCCHSRVSHYGDVVMATVASQITSLNIVYSTVYSGADQRKHQSSASLAFVWGIHRYRWIPRTKGQLRGKCFHLMTSSWRWLFMDMRLFCTRPSTTIVMILTHWPREMGSNFKYIIFKLITRADSKIHGGNMGPTWGRQDPGGSHVGHTNLVIWDRCEIALRWMPPNPVN